MYCPNCGKELPSGNEFCIFCGSRLSPPDQVTPVTPPPVTEPAAPKSAKRGVLLAVIYFALGFLGILVSFGISALQMSATGYYNGSVVTSSIVSALINLGMLIISMIPVVLVLIIRRRHLWMISKKDILLVNFFSVILWLAGFVQTILTTAFFGSFGTYAVVAISVAKNVLSLFGFMALMNGIALSLFILARTSAKKAVIILGSIAAFVMLLITVFQMIAPSVFFRIYAGMGEAQVLGMGLIRIGALCNFLEICFLFTLAACYGFASQTTKRWIPVFIIAFAGKLVLSVLIAVIGISGLHIGVMTFNFILIADAIVMLACALIMLFGAIKNRRA